jgi:hypothetical protein
MRDDVRCEQTVNKCYLEPTSNSLVCLLEFHSTSRKYDIRIDRHNQSSSCELSSEEESSSCEELSC